MAKCIFSLPDEPLFSLAQRLINAFDPNLFELPTQLAPIACDPSLGAQRAVLKPKSQKAPRQFYSGQVVQGNVTFKGGYLPQQPISAEPAPATAPAPPQIGPLGVHRCRFAATGRSP